MGLKKWLALGFWTSQKTKQEQGKAWPSEALELWSLSGPRGQTSRGNETFTQGMSKIMARDVGVTTLMSSISPNPNFSDIVVLSHGSHLPTEKQIPPWWAQPGSIGQVAVS